MITEQIDNQTDVMEAVIFTKITESMVRSTKASEAIPIYKLMVQSIGVPKTKMFTLCPKLLINIVKNN